MCRCGSQVGDVASNEGEYFTPIAPLFWIKGNNEDFDVIAAAVAGQPRRRRSTTCPTADRIMVGPWRVAALGGTFAPSWYHTSAAALPPSRGRRPTAASLKLGKSRDDKRRHFVREEVVACKALAGHRRVPDARGAAALLSRRAAGSTSARP